MITITKYRVNTNNGYIEYPSIESIPPNYNTYEIIEELIDPVAKLRGKGEMLVQEQLEAYAKSLGYDSCLSLTTYINSSVDKFKQEALKFIKIRDIVWIYCYSLLSSDKLDSYTEESFIDEINNLIQTTN